MFESVCLLFNISLESGATSKFVEISYIQVNKQTAEDGDAPQKHD